MGTSRPASASADAKAVRPAQAGHWPKAYKVEFIRHATARPPAFHADWKSASMGASRPASASADAKAVRPAQAGHWPKAYKVEFIRHATARPPVFHADGNRPPWALRARRRPPPTQKPFGRRRPATGRRPLQVEFIRHSRRPPAEGLSRSNSFDTHAGHWPKACEVEVIRPIPRAGRRSSLTQDG